MSWQAGRLRTQGDAVTDTFFDEMAVEYVVFLDREKVHHSHLRRATGILGLILLFAILRFRGFAVSGVPAGQG